MAVTKKNLRQHELIGLCVEVESSSNKANIGLNGKIVNETQKTLVIRDKSAQLKRVFKKKATFEVKLSDKESVKLKGDEIVARPWERISKK